MHAHLHSIQSSRLAAVEAALTDVSTQLAKLEGKIIASSAIGAFIASSTVVIIGKMV